MKKTRNSVTLPKSFQDALVKLVDDGIFIDKNTVIRSALRNLFIKYRVEPFFSGNNETTN